MLVCDQQTTPPTPLTHPPKCGPISPMLRRPAWRAWPPSSAKKKKRAIRPAGSFPLVSLLSLLARGSDPSRTRPGRSVRLFLSWTATLEPAPSSRVFFLAQVCRTRCRSGTSVRDLGCGCGCVRELKSMKGACMLQMLHCLLCFATPSAVRGGRGGVVARLSLLWGQTSQNSASSAARRGSPKASCAHVCRFLGRLPRESYPDTHSSLLSHTHTRTSLPNPMDESPVLASSIASTSMQLAGMGRSLHTSASSARPPDVAQLFLFSANKKPNTTCPPFPLLLVPSQF